MQTSPSFSASVSSSAWTLWNRSLGTVVNPLGGVLIAAIGNVANLLFCFLPNNGVPGSSTPPPSPPTQSPGIYLLPPNWYVLGDQFSYQYDVYLASAQGSQQIKCEDLIGCIPEGAQFFGGLPAIAELTDYAYNHESDGTHDYYAFAPPGSPLASPVWKVYRNVTATGARTWADGNANYDNVGSGLNALTYS